LFGDDSDDPDDPGGSLARAFLTENIQNAAVAGQYDDY